MIGSRANTKALDVIHIKSGPSVADLVGLLRDHNPGAVVVSGNGTSIEGIVSERDVVRRPAEASPSSTSPPRR